MTTTEKLQRIRARCVELLSIAEKRTPGKWGVERTQTTNWIGPMRRSGDGKINIIVCNTNREELKAEFLEQNDADATFIASCAGSAEAGWKATIAAIDAYMLDESNSESINDLSAVAQAIIAAWPEELL